MRLICEQHIFTDRLNAYATVAASPGIDASLRGELEPWVQRAPDLEWMVCRCRPLRDGDWMALSFSMQRTGARRSHIAHTYLVDGRSWAAAGANLPWLALHLPFWSDYRPPPLGIDALAPLEVELDRAGQFPLLRWLCAISEPEAVTHWQAGLLAALAAGEPVRLDFGPPRDPAEAAQRLLGVAAPASPAGMTLWRTAGLLSLIPVVFQRGLSLCINDRARSDALLVIEFGAETPTRFAHTGGAGYLSHCQALLERGSDAELAVFLEQVECYLDTPSVQLLEDATALLIGTAGVNDPRHRIEQLLRFWRRSGVVPQVSLVEALDLVAAADPRDAWATETLTAIAAAALSPQCDGTGIPARVLDLLLGWRVSLERQRAVLRGLRYEARARLWAVAVERGQPPACSPTVASLEQTVVWTDELYSALTPVEKKRALDNIEQLLVAAAPGEPHGILYGLVARLVRLGDYMDESHGALMGPVVERIAALINSNRLGHRDWGLPAIFESPLDTPARRHIAGRLGVLLANQRWRLEEYRQQAIDYIVARPRPELRDVEIHRELCYAFYSIDNVRFDTELLNLVRVQYEFLMLLLGQPAREPLDQAGKCYRLDLPAYSAWLEDGKKRIHQRPYAAFHVNLALTLRILEPLDAFCIAVSYLFADPYDTEPAGELVQRLKLIISNREEREHLMSWFTSAPAGSSSPNWPHSAEDRYSQVLSPRGVATVLTVPAVSESETRCRIGNLYSKVSPLAMMALFVAVTERRKGFGVEYRNELQRQLMSATRWLHPSRHTDLWACLDSVSSSWRKWWPSRR